MGTNAENECRRKGKMKKTELQLQGMENIRLDPTTIRQQKVMVIEKGA